MTIEALSILLRVGVDPIGGRDKISSRTDPEVATAILK
jgi:hypothetical protein